MLRKLWFSLAYLQRPIWDTGISPQELMVFIDTHPPGKALDLGCGTGTNVITLAKHGWDVIGVDFSRRAIQIAKKKAQQNGVDVVLRLADVTRLESINGRFDLILDLGCFHSLPLNKRPAYILKIDSLLADKGSFLLYMFIRLQPDGFGPGASETDIQFITHTLQVVERKDSTERGLRPSAWFTLQKYHRNIG
jgi:cyclopropane fatty-acyl-phospholipid synthase-like methyltransferase